MAEKYHDRNEEIRQKYSAGGTTCKKLSEEYGLSKSYIYLIIRTGSKECYEDYQKKQHLYNKKFYCTNKDRIRQQVKKAREEDKDKYKEIYKRGNENKRSKSGIMSIYIPKEEKEKFKEMCERLNTTMSSVLQEYIKNFIQNNENATENEKEGE